MRMAKELPQFEFLGKLGVGGTAQVHKVRTVQHQIAALKTILHSDNINQEEFKLLAIREQHLLQDINFPGIVKIYDVQTEEPCYICLEYCSGNTLETYHKIDNLQSALNILSSIAINLEFLNLNSLVHADLKPDNIFMPEDITLFATDKLTFTKLSDFSLGKFEEEEHSVRGGLGTVGYMAPETIKENIVSHRSDLFAFGVLAYQMITGVHPFISEDADPMKINSRILEETPPPLSDLRNDLPDKFIQLINQLMEKDASKRPSSAWEVCQTLRLAGATYPFEKVLHPKYALKSQKDYIYNLKVISNNHEIINRDSNQDNSQLRLLLSYNFDKNNLYYSERQFHFKDNPLVASYLFRQTIKQFLKLSYTEKKSIIELSLINNEQNLVSSLLPHLLKPQTVIRTSKRLASVAESDNKHYIAANLYTQSGELLKAENAAYQAAMSYKNKNEIDSALKLLNRVISFGTLLNRKFDIKSLIMVKGDILKDIGETSKAEEVYRNLIDIYGGQNEDELLAETYKDLGDLYKIKKLPNEGIKSLKKALGIYKRIGNKLEVSKTYNNLGNIYMIENSLKTALSYYRKALKVQRKLIAHEEVASTLNNIAVVYGMTNKFKKALKIFTISLTIKKEIGNKGEIARTLNNIGYCYEIIGDARNAAEVLHEAMRYNKEIDSKGELLFNLENLTVLMYSTGQLKESISYLKEGINLAIALNNKPHTSIFSLYLGAVFIRLGKLTEGFKQFEYAENILKTIEDKYLLALLYIEKAQLATLINNKQDTVKLLNLAHAIYSDIKDKTILIKVVLLKLTISNDITLQHEAEKIIDELKLKKEKSILNELKLNHFLSHDSSFATQQPYNDLKKSTSASNEHIDQCQFLTTLAKYELSNNNIARASELANKSIQLAKSRGLVFDHFHALVLLGGILRNQNELENCYAVYKQAFQIAKDIFNQLENDVDKQAFQNKKEFIYLVSEIKKLSKLIGQKKEQVS